MSNLIEVMTVHNCPATIRIDSIVCIEKIRMPEKFNGAETIITIEKGRFIFAKMSYNQLRKILIDYESRFNDDEFYGKDPNFDDDEFYGKDPNFDDDDFHHNIYSDN